MLIRDRLKKIILKLCANQDIVIQEETKFINDIGLDSIMFIQLIVDIENEFNFEIKDIDFELIDTFGKLNLLIAEQIKGSLD